MKKTNLVIFTAFVLIGCIVCDNNVTTTTTTTSQSTTPALSSSTASQSTQTITSESTTTTTLKPSTSVAPSLENSTKLAQYPSNRTKQLNTTSYVCSCDLTFNCDVNCCCDLDCNDAIVEAFHCEIGVDIEDFYHSEGLQRCSVDGGLLCIAHDNVPSMDHNIYVPFHTEYSSYKWPKIALEPSIEYGESSNDFYKYGDAIMTYDTKGEKIQEIKVPAYAIGDDSRCFLTEPVKYLKSKSIKCLRSINELCSYNNELMLQLLNTQLSRRPPKMTGLGSQEAAAADVFSITIEACKHTYTNCTQISYVNDDDASSKSSKLEVLEFLGNESDVYEDINFKFVINDTKISSATVKFSCRNEMTCSSGGVVDDLEPSSKLIQSIQIEFINANENRNEHHRIRMRSRGYNNDETIVASRFRPINETAPTSSEMMFDFFRNDTNSKNFYMKLPESKKRGECSMNDDQYDAIRFNENSQTRCNVLLMRDVNSNFTTCQQIQQQLIYFLFNTLNLTSNYTRDEFLSDVYVSKFWTPRYDYGSWTRVSFHNIPHWNPEMHESEKMLKCSHIITTANYKFLYSTIKTSGTKKFENFIENLIIEFGNVDELHLPIEDIGDNATMTLTTTHVEIQINVQFINLFQKHVENHATMMMMSNSSFVILILHFISVFGTLNAIFVTN